MKISIITASYNQGKFIKKCIDGVIAQQDTHLEHIILDNCSTDATPAILSAYQADHPNHIELKIFVEPDKGQTYAINKGFLMATGDIVCWLNTDEWYTTGSLAKVVDFFANHADVDVVFGDSDFVDSEGLLVSRKREFLYSEAMLIYYGCYLPSCATFIRRRVIDAGILLDPEFKVAMDYDWYVRISKAGYRFAHLTTTVALFTWHETNISTVFAERRKIERLMIQDRESGISGPAGFRTFIYSFLYCFWIAARVSRRFVERFR